MLSKITVALLVVLVVFTGCQKDMQSEAVSTSAINNLGIFKKGTADTSGRWFGTSKSIYSDPDAFPDTVSENSLINNGKASLPPLAKTFPPDRYALTSIDYYLPADQEIKGDSVVFTAIVQDSNNIAELDIVGSQNVAHAVFEKLSSDSSKLVLSVGKTVSSVTVPAISFTAFRIVSLVVRDNRAVLLISDKRKLSVVFNNADKIGDIKLLSVGFFNHPGITSPDNGSIACAGVRLFNSYSAKLLMKETFSLTGKSNTIFY